MISNVILAPIVLLAGAGGSGLWFRALMWATSGLSLIWASDSSSTREVPCLRPRTFERGDCGGGVNTVPGIAFEVNLCLEPNWMETVAPNNFG